MTDRLPSDYRRKLPPPQQDIVQGFIPAELLFKRHVNYTPPAPPKQRKRQHFDPFH